MVPGHLQLGEETPPSPMDVGEVFAAKDQHDVSATMDIDGDVPPSKKRKTKASTRGVAHLTPEQLAKKRANGTMNKTPCSTFVPNLSIHLVDLISFHRRALAPPVKPIGMGLALSPTIPCHLHISVSNFSSFYRSRSSARHSRAHQEAD